MAEIGGSDIFFLPFVSKLFAYLLLYAFISKLQHQGDVFALDTCASLLIHQFSPMARFQASLKPRGILVLVNIGSVPKTFSQPHLHFIFEENQLL